MQRGRRTPTTTPASSARRGTTQRRGGTSPRQTQPRKTSPRGESTSPRRVGESPSRRGNDRAGARREMREMAEYHKRNGGYKRK